MPEAGDRQSKNEVSMAAKCRGRPALESRARRPRHNRKYISYLLRFIVAGGALYLAFRGEDFSKILAILKEVKFVLTEAIGVYIVAQLIFVARWSLLLKVQSISIGFWPAVRLHFLGLFYNNCLPGAIGGDLPRAWYVTRHTDKKLEAALSVFVDRVIGLIGMLIMAFGCYWLGSYFAMFSQNGAGFISEESREEGLNFSFDIDLFGRMAEYKAVFIWLGAAFTIILVFMVSNKKGRNYLKRGFDAISRRGMSVLSKTRQSIRIYCHKWPAIVGALVLTFCCQGLTVVAMWLVGSRIGIDVSAKYYFIFFPISWLLGAMPISVGGLGIMEGWLKMMFMRVGTMSGENALALALCQRLVFLLASLPGAIVHLIGAHLPKDFFVDYGKPME
jgi:uncharacterized membrane protein YbhN (UPF0104 family)